MVWPAVTPSPSRRVSTSRGRRNGDHRRPSEPDRRADRQRVHCQSWHDRSAQRPGGVCSHRPGAGDLKPGEASYPTELPGSMYDVAVSNFHMKHYRTFLLVHRPPSSPQPRSREAIFWPSASGGGGSRFTPAQALAAQFALTQCGSRSIMWLVPRVPLSPDLRASNHPTQSSRSAWR